MCALARPGSVEQRGFFTNHRGRELFFAAHLGGSGRACVLCGPSFGERGGSHPVFVALGRALARRGVLALRFDYEGEGDSDGAPGDVDLADWSRDVAAACALLRQRHRVTELWLLGLRLGAVVALRAAPAVGCRGVVLWEPVVDGPEYLRECLAINVAAQLVTHGRAHTTRDDLERELRQGRSVGVGSFDLGPRMAASLNAADVPRLARAAPCGLKVVALTARGRQEAARLGVGQPRFSPAPRFWQREALLEANQGSLVDLTVRLVLGEPRHDAHVRPVS